MLTIDVTSSSVYAIGLSDGGSRGADSKILYHSMIVYMSCSVDDPVVAAQA